MKIFVVVCEDAEGTNGDLPFVEVLTTEELANQRADLWRKDPNYSRVSIHEERVPNGK